MLFPCGQEVEELETVQEETETELQDARTSRNGPVVPLIQVKDQAPWVHSDRFKLVARTMRFVVGRDALANCNPDVVRRCTSAKDAEAKFQVPE